MSLQFRIVCSRNEAIIQSESNAPYHLSAGQAGLHSTNPN